MKETPNTVTYCNVENKEKDENKQNDRAPDSDLHIIDTSTLWGDPTLQLILTTSNWSTGLCK